MIGLVSVSFRSLSPEAILALSAEAGLDAVEWGGDIHVPAGDMAAARRVRVASATAGLRVSSYGSYYRLGASDPAEFPRVLASADALGTDLVRVWAFTRNRASVDDGLYAHIVRDTRRACDMARETTLCLECHNGTLTEDFADALTFIRDVDRANLRTYWQPNQFRSAAYNLASAEALAPLCRSVHVFHWTGNDRHPLAEGEALWHPYIRALRGAPVPPAFLLEFMHDDSPASLPAAAATLRGWLSSPTS